MNNDHFVEETNSNRTFLLKSQLIMFLTRNSKMLKMKDQNSNGTFRKPKHTSCLEMESFKQSMIVPTRHGKAPLAALGLYDISNGVHPTKAHVGIPSFYFYLIHIFKFALLLCLL